MALAHLRCGDRVARAGWNGKGMSLEYGEPESAIVYGGTDGWLEERSWLTAFIVTGPAGSSELIRAPPAAGHRSPE